MVGGGGGFVGDETVGVLVGCGVSVGSKPVGVGVMTCVGVSEPSGVAVRSGVGVSVPRGSIVAVGCDGGLVG